MITIECKSNCCGCEACAQKCTMDAIQMLSDYEGFFYPVVDHKKCVNCGLCDQVCPIHISAKKNPSIVSYAIQSRDNSVRTRSTAGGVFYLLAKQVIEHGGVVFGAAFTENAKVHHIAAETIEELYPLCMSKYVQSRIGKTYQEVKKYLTENRQVLFAGTPCQCVGLKSYLGKEYENLFIIDFLCHGVPSPAVWNKYAEAMRERYGACYFQFRNKSLGYKRSGIEFVSSDGRSYYANDTDKNDIKFMSRAFFGEISSRPSCHNCRFKTRERVSDVTLGDLWNIKKYDQDMDDDKGTTFVSIHTEKAREMLLSLEDVTIKVINIEDYLKDDGVNMICSMSPNPHRKDFFQDLNELNIDELYDKYLMQKDNKVKEFIKSAFKTVGILFLFQRMKYKIKQRLYRRKARK